MLAETGAPSTSCFGVVGKVAAVMLAFWVMKILATTLGETAGDFLSMTLNLGYYVGFAITFAALAVVLFLQVRSERYNPVLFWLAIVATTTAGTEISDMMDRSFGLGYAWGSLLLVAGLGVKRRWNGTPDRRAKGTPLPDGGCARAS